MQFVVLTSIPVVFWIFIAGGLGSVSRYSLSLLFNPTKTGSAWPFGTWVANIIGALLIGAVYSLSLDAKLLPKETALILTTGFLGGLTTFSSMSYEGLQLGEQKGLLFAIFYLLLSVCLGVLFAYLGARGVRAIYTS